MEQLFEFLIGFDKQNKKSGRIPGLFIDAWIYAVISTNVNENYP
jgi:hypothetical protein